MEEPVTILSKSGRKLYGIAHVPEGRTGGKGRIGINLLNPGIKYRVAPNRLNVKLARTLCEKGFYVLRFDPSGIGDSEGEIPENVLVHDIWETIQTGLLVEDTVCANDLFVEKYGLEELVLAGSCGGAMTALLAGAEDPRVGGLVLVDVPINLRTARTTFADAAVQGGEKADWLFSEYIKRLFRPESWVRFLTLRTDFRALRKVMFLKIRKIIGTITGGPEFPEAIEKLCEEGKLNRLFFDSFETVMKRETPILFVLAGNDPGIEIFQHFFQGVYAEQMRLSERRKELYETFVVENANHVYSLKEWQDQLIHKVVTWLPAMH